MTTEELGPGLRAVFNPDGSRKQLYSSPAQAPPYNPNNMNGFGGMLGGWAHSIAHNSKLPSLAKATTPLGGAGIGAAVGGGLGAAFSGLHNTFSSNGELSTPRVAGLGAILGSLLGAWRQQMHKQAGAGDALVQLLQRANDVPNEVKAVLMYVAQNMTPQDKAQLLSVLRTVAGASVGAVAAMVMNRMGLLPAAVGFALGGLATRPSVAPSYLSQPHSLFS